MTNQISEKIYKKIKEEQIKPRPRWEFLLKDYTVWSFFGVSLVVGSLAVAVLLYMLVNNDWDLYSYVSGSFLGFLFATLPYFWLAIFLLFIVLAYFNLKHTKKGYLYSLGKIIALSLLISFIFGGSLYAAGLGKTIDKVAGGQVPYYERMMAHRQAVWHQPQKGLLVGEVSEIVSPVRFNLVDPGGEQWCVECPRVPRCPLVKENIQTPVKIVGEEGEDCFQARIIRSFRTMPHMMGVPGKGHCGATQCPMRNR